MNKEKPDQFLIEADKLSEQMLKLLSNSNLLSVEKSPIVRGLSVNFLYLELCLQMSEGKLTKEDVIKHISYVWDNFVEK